MSPDQIGTGTDWTNGMDFIGEMKKRKTSLGRLVRSGGIQDGLDESPADQGELDFSSPAGCDQRRNSKGKLVHERASVCLSM